jgi:Concanavalin A-like lectin/glucanases superfamily
MATIGGSNIATDGLVLALDAANYRSYPGSGTAWSDISGYPNTITTNNVFFASTGSLIYSDYSGSYAYTNVGPNLNNTLATSSFTIEMWISRNIASVALGDRESLFSNASNAAGWRFGLGINGGLYYLVGGTNGAGYDERTLGSNYVNLDGTWNHVAMVYDRQAQLGSCAMYAYAKGVQQATFAMQPAASSSFIGSVGVGDPGISQWCCSSYKGRVAKLSVYNRALTAQEIQQNYNAQKSRYNL